MLPEIKIFVEKSMSSRYKKILIATDGSDYVKKAVTHAIEIAKLSGAKLYAVYVIEKKPTSGIKSYFYTDIPTGGVKEILRKEGLNTDIELRILREEGDVAIKYIEYLAKKEGLHIEKLIVTGNPAEEILKLAEENSVDLIVMGTLGRSGIEKFLLGSVADKVIRNSTIPVLVVRK